MLIFFRVNTVTSSPIEGWVTARQSLKCWYSWVSASWATLSVYSASLMNRSSEMWLGSGLFLYSDRIADLSISNYDASMAWFDWMYLMAAVILWIS